MADGADVREQRMAAPSSGCGGGGAALWRRWLVAQREAGPFTLNDHVGTTLRMLLVVFLLRRRWPRPGVARRARWSCIFGVLALEAHSWLARWVRPPGHMVTLSMGRVHVVDEGPTSVEASEAPPVVLVHGFAGSHHYYMYLAKALRDAGRRVVRFDNYGRGFSSAGAGPMDAELFVDQLRGVLDHLGLAKAEFAGAPGPGRHAFLWSRPQGSILACTPSRCKPRSRPCCRRRFRAEAEVWRGLGDDTTRI
mmetsp:Transcript_33369/g.86591  ORF Transcript_33369/g.86591 Transcript_33369/m.86591 type:complete len:251 (-) Transcript_33369:342-1094(-)